MSSAKNKRRVIDDSDSEEVVIVSETGPGKKAAKKKPAPQQPPATSSQQGSRATLASFLQLSQPKAGAAKAETSAAAAKASADGDLPSSLAAARAASSAQASTSEEWCTKHAPRTEAELAVSKKKVAQVKGWLEWQRGLPVNSPANRLLLITGPAGVGKSATVRALAADLGFEIVEWTSPVPTLFEEHLHARGADATLEYQSKLDLFEDWALSVRKCAPLPLFSARPAAGGPAPAAGSQPPPGAPRTPPAKLILLEDLPLAAGPERRDRLAALLRGFATASRFPAVVAVTGNLADNPRDDESSFGRVTAELLDAGAAHAVFAGASKTALTGALRRILASERAVATDTDVDECVRTSLGDIRSAINALQLLCTGTEGAAVGGREKPSKRRKKGAAAPASPGAGAGPGSRHFTRNEQLSIFHALGKILYNKRLPEEARGDPSPRDRATALLPHLRRPPPENPDPEAVVARAGLSAASVVGFLHENLPDFVADDAVEDLAAAVSGFSDAMALLAATKADKARAADADTEVDPSLLASAAAGSFAARSSMFHAVRLAPPRWLPLRGPAAGAVENTIAANRDAISRCLLARACEDGAAACVGGAASSAAEVVPFLKAFEAAAPGRAGPAPRLRGMQQGAQPRREGGKGEPVSKTVSLRAAGGAAGGWGQAGANGGGGGGVTGGGSGGGDEDKEPEDVIEDS